MKNIEIIEVLSNLIKFKSITPNDDGCQTYIGGYLKQLGFNILILFPEYSTFSLLLL